MKAIRYGISGALAAGLALIAACGGSTDGSGDSSGAAGAAGKTSSSTAGASSSSGGTTGLHGAAGAVNNPACPATAPANSSACTLTGMQSTCLYTGMSCRCARTGGGGGMLPGGMSGGSGTAARQWECTEVLICPATKPTAGDACMPAPGSCQYAGMGSCSCSAQTSKWSCRGGTTGGGGAGGAFTGFGGAFTGFAGAFTGFGGGFPGFGGSGTGVAGDASGTTCPATKPAADSACTGTGACPYTGGGCVCSGDKWTCL